MDTIKASADMKNLFGGDHSLEVAVDYSDDKYMEWWQKWVIIQSQNMQTNHAYIMSEIVDKIPTLFVRYEDLVRDPRSCLVDVMKFALGVDSIEGTIVEKRIEEVAVNCTDSSVSFCSSARSFSSR